MPSEANIAVRPIQRVSPSLPKAARTRSGVIFDSTQDVWSYRDGFSSVHINFLAVPALSPHLRDSLKRTLLWYVEHASVSHLQNMHAQFLWLAKFLAATGDRLIEQVSSLGLLNYKAS